MSALGLTKIGMAIVTVMAIVASDMFGTSMVVPVQTMYAASLGTSKAYIGLLGSIFSACSFMSSLVMGRISDMYGRRITFLVTGFGASIAYAGAIFSTSFYNLLICRSLAGLLSGTVGNAFAYLADITSKEERAIYMSYMSAVMSSCFIVGPMIGGGLSIYGLRVPYLGATVFSGIVMVLTYTSLQEPSSLLMKKVELCKEEVSTINKQTLNKEEEEDENDDDEIGNVEIGRMLKEKSDRYIGQYGSSHNSHSTTPRNSDKSNNNNNNSNSGKTTVFPHHIGESSPLKRTSLSSIRTSLSSTTGDHPPSLDDDKGTGLGPWIDPKALLVGGLCNFLRTFVFFAVMTMLPLMVMEMEAQSFNRQGLDAQSKLNRQGIELSSTGGYAPTTVGYEGIVMESSSSLFGGVGKWGYYNKQMYYNNNNNNNFDHTNLLNHHHHHHHHHRVLQEDKSIETANMVSNDIAHHVALTVGYLVGSMGVVQTVGALVVFPVGVKRLGPLYTAAFGAFLMAMSGVILSIVSTVATLLPVLMMLALGACLVGPVLTSHLTQLAPPGKNAEYLSFTGTFGSLATMCSGNITFLYAHNKMHALGLIGIMGFGLTLVLSFLAYQEALAQALAASEKNQQRSKLAAFFGFGEELPQEQFFDELQLALLATIQERGWSTAMRSKKGQILLHELILHALPQLPTDFEEKMMVLNGLFDKTGHEDWALEHQTILSLRG